MLSVPRAENGANVRQAQLSAFIRVHRRPRLAGAIYSMNLQLRTLAFCSGNCSQLRETLLKGALDAIRVAEFVRLPTVRAGLFRRNPDGERLVILWFADLDHCELRARRKTQFGGEPHYPRTPLGRKNEDRPRQAVLISELADFPLHAGCLRD